MVAWIEGKEKCLLFTVMLCPDTMPTSDVCSSLFHLSSALNAHSCLDCYPLSERSVADNSLHVWTPHAMAVSSDPSPILF